MGIYLEDVVNIPALRQHADRTYPLCRAFLIIQLAIARHAMFAATARSSFDERGVCTRITFFAASSRGRCSWRVKNEMRSSSTLLHAGMSRVTMMVSGLTLRDLRFAAT